MGNICLTHSCCICVSAFGEDLATTSLVKEEQYAVLTPPIFFAHNGGGDYYASDGNILVISYTLTLIPVHQPAWAIEGLKTGSFLFYDALRGLVGPMMPLLVLVFSLLGGIELWRITARKRLLKKT